MLRLLEPLALERQQALGAGVVDLGEVGAVRQLARGAHGIEILGPPGARL